MRQEPESREAFQARMAVLFQTAARDPKLSDLEVRNIVAMLSLEPLNERDIQRTHELAAKYGWK